MDRMQWPRIEEIRQKVINGGGLRALSVEELVFLSIVGEAKMMEHRMRHETLMTIHFTQAEASAINVLLQWHTRQKPNYDSGGSREKLARLTRKFALGQGGTIRFTAYDDIALVNVFEAYIEAAQADPKFRVPLLNELEVVSVCEKMTNAEVADLSK
jgi:hypothetical protein